MARRRRGKSSLTEAQRAAHRAAELERDQRNQAIDKRVLPIRRAMFDQQPNKGHQRMNTPEQDKYARLIEAALDGAERETMVLVLLAGLATAIAMGKPDEREAELGAVQALLRDKVAEAVKKRRKRGKL